MLGASVMKEIKRIFSNLFLFQANAPFRLSAFQFFSVVVWISINIYLFKVNHKNSRKRWKICLELTIKTLERRQRLVSLLLTYFTPLCSFLWLTLNIAEINLKWVTWLSENLSNFLLCKGSLISLLILSEFE